MRVRDGVSEGGGPVSEKLKIVRLTMEPGASVAEIARAYGVNANQVFTWRKLFEKGQLRDAGARSTALLPVAISAEIEGVPEPNEQVAAEAISSGGSIHIELPGKAMISVERAPVDRGFIPGNEAGRPNRTLAGP